MCSLALLALSVPLALAEDPLLPAGWLVAADGSYRHVPSGAICPLKIRAFSLQGLWQPVEQGALGACEYEDAEGGRGEIRVRRYLPGVGETALAIENDRALMEAPDGTHTKIASTYRVGPGPAIDGEPTQRVMLTVVRNGLLIDCAAWVKKAGIRDDQPDIEFPIFCLHTSAE